MLRLVVAVALVSASALPVSAASLAERLAPCLACHGENGQSETPDVPSLGAQPSAATLIQLYLFREKQRVNEIMNEMAKGLSDSDLQAFSDFIAKLPPPKPPADAPDPARMANGSALAAQNRCGICHNPDFSGRDSLPRLANQREEYLVKSMRDYKSGARPGYDPAMLEVVRTITDAQILDIAYYIAHVR